MKEILCISSYPPRECGIATFTDDLVRAVHQKFGTSYAFRVCPLESEKEKQVYAPIVKYTLDTSSEIAYTSVANLVEQDADIELVLVQHEFGLFHGQEDVFLQFLKRISQPKVIVFHTVLSCPGKDLQVYLQQVARACEAVIVMTQHSSNILQEDYHIPGEKIHVIPHGTHLVSQRDQKILKEKYGVADRKVLTTFGLLSAGKSIETTIEALPDIVKENPSVIFLIIGKTHPSVIKAEGEQYREMLEKKIKNLGVCNHVRFINAYLELPILLEYLQLTDIYLFTSSDPNQAVSGTFVYALGCGCPIVATPIPHALELLHDHSGIIFDFKDSMQLGAAVNRLLANEGLRQRMRLMGLQKIMITAWENSAIAHVNLFKKIIGDKEELCYSLPPVNLSQVKRMSRNFGIIQFSKGNRPDIRTGYTLDDNARALMAMCCAYIATTDSSCKRYIRTYLNFIVHCMQPDGSFLNYVDRERNFTSQNQKVGLDDSTGRAICALGYFLHLGEVFPEAWIREASRIMEQAIPPLHAIRSPRGIAFAIKGLYYGNCKNPTASRSALIATLADKLANYYQQTAVPEWKWFEESLTYDNSIMPEALLYAFQDGGNTRFRDIARESFDFLLKQIFIGNGIKVISNRGWKLKGKSSEIYGEQPVDIANTVITLGLFHEVFHEMDYRDKQRIAFNWFLGNNHLHQIIYNPATGGCYDGLEEDNVNLNQGAESTVCYLMARLSL